MERLVRWRRPRFGSEGELSKVVVANFQWGKSSINRFRLCPQRLVRYKFTPKQRIQGGARDTGPGIQSLPGLGGSIDLSEKLRVAIPLQSIALVLESMGLHWK